MMHSSVGVKACFAKLNSALGSCGSPSPYVWDDGLLFQRNMQFDEAEFRKGKLEVLLNRELGLSILERKQAFDQVVFVEKQLLTQMSHVSVADRQVLEQRFDQLVLEAIVEAESQASLRISKENIINSRPLNDGWMCYEDVNTMVQLAQKRRFSAPDKGKFVNRGR